MNVNVAQGHARIQVRLVDLKTTNHFQSKIQRKVQKGLSLFPSNTLSLASMKVPFPRLFCLQLHDFTQIKPKIFWGRTADPPPPPT